MPAPTIRDCMRHDVDPERQTRTDGRDPLLAVARHDAPSADGDDRVVTEPTDRIQIDRVQIEAKVPDASRGPRVIIEAKVPDAPMGQAGPRIQIEARAATAAHYVPPAPVDPLAEAKTKSAEAKLKAQARLTSAYREPIEPDLAEPAAEKPTVETSATTTLPAGVFGRARSKPWTRTPVTPDE